MLVLKIIGWVLLALLLLLLLVGLFVLLARTRVDFRGKNGELELRIGIGPFKIKLLPPPDRPEKAEKPKKAPPEAKEKKPQKPRRQPDFKALDYGEVLSLVLDLLSQMKNKLILEALLLNLVIATGDAAKTGLLLGSAGAAAGIIIPFLEQNFITEQLQITLNADFEEKQTKWAAVAVFAVRPISVMHVLWRSRRELYALYKQVMKKEEAIKHE